MERVVRRPGAPGRGGSLATARVAARSPRAAHSPACPFPIVAIGASAGGLEALELFLGSVPANAGAAYIVVQHLDPDHKGMMPELLQRASALPVAQAKNRLKVRPGNASTSFPPNKDLSILHDSLYLLDPVAPRGLRLPIDFFFRALADDRREHAIGVILSGMGSDGTLGLRAIKEHGGLVLVQDPATAKFDGMPRSAIDTGLVDIVAPAAELPARIADTLHHVRPRFPASAAAEGETAVQSSALEKICILLRARTGHDFSLYKKSTLYRRIERRMAIHQIDRIGDYVHYLRENPQEVDLLFKELLIGVTSFFRDPACWDHLRDHVLPELLTAYPAGAALRAWVAGCSTGEEAYSLAIVFREAAGAPAATGPLFAADLRHRPRPGCHRPGSPGHLSGQHRRRRLGRAADGASSSRMATAIASARKSARWWCSPRRTCSWTRRSPSWTSLPAATC